MNGEGFRVVGHNPAATQKRIAEALAAGPVPTGDDPITRYADHFKVSRREAKSRLFRLIYGGAQIDIVDYVNQLIAADKKNSEELS